LQFSGDSKSLHWSLGPELFTRPLSDAFAFLAGAPEKLPDPEGVGSGMDISLDAKFGKPATGYAVTGARLLTMKGDEVIEDGVVVVEGNRIKAVGKKGSVAIPAGATTIDLTGKTIMPGLVDVHWHGEQGSSQIIPEQSSINYASLAYGVTTLHDPSND